MGLVSALPEIMRRHATGDMLSELIMFVSPLWAAVVLGVLVGWIWKPKWANFGVEKLTSSSSPHASSDSTTSKFNLCSIPSLNSLKLPWIVDYGVRNDSLSSQSSQNSSFNSSLPSQVAKERSGFVTEDDLRHLWKLVEVKDGGPAWIQMMDRTNPTFSYQAWRRDPENGPPQYRSRTFFEDATPEMVRDFFWDDGFRAKWDDMLIYASTHEECLETGTMVVQWVRKFPFFCSDREYIIGRRIWDAGRVFYCITKGVNYPSIPRRKKPRRVDLYYSSWCIRAAESRRGDGQMTACEVILFHHEDMGIPWEIAKLGVRQGMWGAVKKIEPGLRAYQKLRAAESGSHPSPEMARINTKVNLEDLSKERESFQQEEVEARDSPRKPSGKSSSSVQKVLVVGGAIALACTLDKGLLTKAVIFGVARRFAKMGKRL
ncbi:PREDICTED: uncharacterized protein LOC104823628 [Tarenaya hassleriana]|uniref:uncharacterized protein LOC104823628 n=1 Tax=Tarenaya hassleriana TaxID=28532 RepID=UPI00053C80E1|nr:PREDICTED: uncharacterized protein LOC104823628 [Tarenaya hassleriana]